ncbi:MAG: HAMP domain-containing histidine kinase [Tannerellaceae bacterium]|jgi:two-component system phosphate regulon sensor histidine kinase PhoR|nr:HAMP domain-containing histidine kinase [Tannerellaceae bacterium]
MEKRIRIVWALSLVSALLVIGVQGYWLYNQYRYVVDAFSEELAQKVRLAGDKEYALREASGNASYRYIITKKMEAEKTDTLDSQRQQIFFMLNRINGGESSVLNFTWDGKLPEDSLQAGIRRMFVNLDNPFRRERLDSILTTLIPDIAYTIQDYPAADTTFRIASSWEKTGDLLHPQIRVPYLYNPLEQKGVWINLEIPPQPIFRRMAVQLALGCGLILLLTGCLVFQIKTILRQKKLGELRESFVNTMIHELKRPVQTLKTFVSFLGNKEMRSDEAVTGQVVHDAMFELDNLSAYLNKLKDMLRADSETTPLHITFFDLQELTEKVIRLTLLPAGKKVTLSAVYEPEPLPPVEADPVHLANILDNLIENAVKYSGSEVAIEVRVCRSGRDFQLTVADNGIGILPNEREKVFDKFFRGSNLPDKQIPGLGLGLSYVKLITEAHGGAVSLSGGSGRGTSIHLSFPQ